MTPERWQQAKELLTTILARPPEGRQSYLEQICDDERLRREVESLLGFEDVSDNFMETPVFDVHDDAAVGRRIGPYRTLRLLGRGGMGAVYLAAREENYQQQVALKLIKRGMDTDEIIRRFHNERQILARLDHPNIARLLDGGTTEDGLPYFVMEYVEGQPIDRYCDVHQLPVRKRLELFRRVCSAVQLSHQNLVVHRDLKPGNVLVTEDGVPKLLDFGIAKLLQRGLARTLVTAPDVYPMTLKYASPEQVRAESVTTSSDIYSLGVLLYELLTGRSPYRLHGLGLVKSAQVICEHEPTRPSAVIQRAAEIRSADGTAVHLTSKSVSRARGSDPRGLRRRLRGDLDSIVLKALSKGSRRRYGSVERFSEDIRHHLEGRPVIARRSTFAYRAEKLIRRNKLAVAALLLILGFAMTVTFLWRQAVRERTRALHAHVVASEAQAAAVHAQALAVREEKRAQRISQFLENLFKSSGPDEAKGEDVRVREILERATRRINEDLEDEPELRADLLGTIGNVYKHLGLYAKARGLLEAALEVLEGHHGGDHPEVAKAINNLAVLLYSLGDYKGAEDGSRKALDMRRRLGQEGIELVITMNNLAASLMNQGKYVEAEKRYHEALAIRRGHYGSAHLDVASSLRHLGTLLYLKDDLEGAESALRLALEIRKDALGADHTGVANVLSSLGRVLVARTAYREARELYAAALAIRRQRLGEEHPHVALTLKDQAALRLATGDREGAENLLEQALEILRKSKSADSWEIADAKGIQCACLVAQRRYEEAEPCLIASYETIKRVRGEHAMYTRDARSRLVTLYERSHRPEEAARYRAALRRIGGD